MFFKKLNRTEFKGKIVGMVLGDATLTRNRKNSHLAIGHSIKQREYFERKVGVLKELTTVNVRERISRIDGKEYRQLICETKSHPIYTELRDRFYYQGRKTVDEFLMKTLSVEGLAYWYQDDGTKGTGVKNQQAIICTDAFNKVEQDFMGYWLAKRFGLHFEPKKHKNTFRLRLRTNEVDKFSEMISPYIVESMKYKTDFHKPREYAIKFVCKECGKDSIGRKDTLYRSALYGKFCSTSCSQKYLWKTGRSNLFKNKKLRRYSLNSMAT